MKQVDAENASVEQTSTSKYQDYAPRNIKLSIFQLLPVSRLFVSSGKEMECMKGTTQVDPISMSIRGISIILLFRSLKGISAEILKHDVTSKMDRFMVIILKPENCVS